MTNPFYGAITTGALAAPTTSRGQLLRLYPQFTSVLPLFLSGGDDQYDGLQIRLDKRFSSGFQLQSSYAWARNFDNGTNHQNSFDPLADYAVSPQDIRQRFIASYIYALPIGRGRALGSHMSPLADVAFGGWEINGITTLQTGTPLQVTAANTSGLGNPVEYANWSGVDAALHTDIHTRLAHSFNTSNFSQPDPFTLGTSPAYLNDLRAPGLNSTDLSFFKEFGAAERLRLQFRAEAFNVFNHVQFGSPDLGVNDTSFGAITTQANSPRQLQFGLKLLF